MTALPFCDFRFTEQADAYFRTLELHLARRDTPVSVEVVDRHHHAFIFNAYARHFGSRVTWSPGAERTGGVYPCWLHCVVASQSTGTRIGNKNRLR